MHEQLRIRLRAGVVVAIITVLLVPVPWSGYTAQAFAADQDAGPPDLSSWSRRVLSERGFVVVPSDATSISEAYLSLRARGADTFITADTVLRTTRLFLDEVLLELEERELYDRLTQLSREMARLSEEQYLRAQDQTVREAARLNYAYFAVGLSLLDPEFFPSEAGLALVERELDLIEEGRFLGFSPIMGATPLDDVAGPGEDYSNYVPTGHYASSERLARFHRAVTWYGRMAFALPEGRRGDNLLTIQGLLVARALEEEAGEWYELWERTYEPLLFFHGGAGDPTVEDYMEIAREVFGEAYDIELLADQEAIGEFVEHVGRIAPTHFETHTLRGMRFLPPRVFRDAEYFRRLGVGTRGGPSPSLSLMALLGSSAARRELDRADAFGSEVYRLGYREIELELERLTYGDWTRDLYWSWLHIIAGLFGPAPDTRPDYMRTEAWESRMLSTGAAAWVDLRRAPARVAEPTRALRAALPSGEGSCAMVEPYPELYVRIDDLVGHVRDTLWEHELLSRDLAQRLDAFAGFIGGLERSCFGLLTPGTLVRISSGSGDVGDVDAPVAESDPQPFISTAFGDLSTGIAVDVGLGRPDLIYLDIGEGGEKTVFAGVISSFYEVERELATERRLGTWERRFASDATTLGPPERPRWALEFVEE